MMKKMHLPDIAYSAQDAGAREVYDSLRRLSKSYRTDSAFRSRCESHPFEVLSEHGIAVRDGLSSVAFHLSDSREVHFVMPPDLNRELSVRELSPEVSGGTPASSVSTAGTAGTASTFLSCVGSVGTAGSIGTASSDSAST
jgi:hypothetical protein